MRIMRSVLDEVMIPDQQLGASTSTSFTLVERGIREFGFNLLVFGNISPVVFAN